MDNRFDLYELPQGHEERFEAKLDARLVQRRRRRLTFRLCAAAAGVAVLFWIGTRARSPFWRAHTPEAVYAAYLEQVGELYEMLATKADNDTADWEAILSELTDENVPLYDQLPEEMSRREKMAILKRHYGGILQEAGQLQEMNQK